MFATIIAGLGGVVHLLPWIAAGLAAVAGLWYKHSATKSKQEADVAKQVATQAKDQVKATQNTVKVLKKIQKNQSDVKTQEQAKAKAEDKSESEGKRDALNSDW